MFKVAGKNVELVDEEREVVDYGEVYCGRGFLGCVEGS